MKATRINGTWTYYINGVRMTRQELEGLIMTPEQVSALSDTELNRAMIWLYPQKWKLDYYEAGGLVYCNSSRVGLVKIDYLTDYNLTMPLVIKNNIWLQPPHMPDNKWHCYDCDDKASSSNTNPRRAACECLVLIALADK